MAFEKPEAKIDEPALRAAAEKLAIENSGSQKFLFSARTEEEKDTEEDNEAAAKNEEDNEAAAKNEEDNEAVDDKQEDEADDSVNEANEADGDIFAGGDIATFPHYSSFLKQVRRSR